MRLFRLLPLMLFLLLCGCQGGDSAAGSLPDLDKAQEVRVIPAGETAPTQVLTEKSQIEALILAMDLDHWSTADLPPGLRPAGTLSFTQQPTQTVWQKEAGDELRELCQIQLYQDAPYLTLTTLGLSLDVAISDQAAQELTHNLFP